MTEEIWEVLGFEGMLNQAKWPTYEEEKTVENIIEMAIQINGKVRGRVNINKDADHDTVLATVKADEKIKEHLEGKQIVKEIYVPGKICNIVVK
jgi:leucyl-tRNA synthetase